MGHSLRHAAIPWTAQPILVLNKSHDDVSEGDLECILRLIKNNSGLC